MTRLLEIVLGDPGDHRRELSLFYQPGSTSIAGRYFDAVAEVERAGLAIIDGDRFHNFPHSPMDRPWIAAELNALIDVVNGWAPGTIRHRASADLTQDQLNRLHLYFEQLRGSVLAPGAFYVAGPPEVKAALRRYNLMIHRFEDRVRFERHGGYGSAHAVLTFDEARPRYPLEDDDYPLFSRRNVFGALMVNYCELGKPLLDAIADKDEHIGDDNVRPLRFYSADALLHFGATTSVRDYLAAEAKLFLWWYSDEAAPFRALGFTPHDPRNAMGHLTVASLDRERGAIAGLSEAAIVDLVGRHQAFLRVHCHA
ncbi:MAG: hypothetical protein U1F43_03930 [Myxococcota bacterium]